MPQSRLTKIFRAAPWLLLLATAAAWPQVPLAPARPQRHAYVSPSLYRIAGTVVNASTGEPVRQATVATLAEASSRTVATVHTDDEGRFALERLPAAKYQLTASKRGYRTAFYDEHEEYNSAIVTGEGQDTEHLTFRLPPGAELRVAVTDDGGDPVENAKILLFRRLHSGEPGGRIIEDQQAVTDDTGVQEFGNLAPGEYLVAVKAEPWYAMHKTAGTGQKQGSTLDVAYPVTFFDGVTDEAAATPLVLTEGRHEEVTINLQAVPALHLLVQAPKSQNGSMARPELRQSIFGTQISADSAGSPYRMQDGMVEITGVAPGRYELAQGNPPRVVELDAANSQRIDPEAGATTVAVHGALRTVSDGTLPSEAGVLLTGHDPAHPQEPVQASSNHGKFSFAAVPPGSWELWVTSAGKTLPVVSTTTGGKTRAGNLVTVADHPLTLTVTVMPTETRIEGFVRKNGKGLAGVMVVLVPQIPNASEDLFRRDQSDSDGSFALRDAVPGSYTVVAIEDGWQLEWSRSDVMSRFLSRGIAVTVTEKSGKLSHLSEAVPVQSLK
jgi:hypothetical protein